jgi:predicted metal-dependent hydrolase
MKMPVEVKQIIRSKRKTLALIVKPDGSLVVRAPLRTPQRAIREFIEKNVQWIERKQAEARSALASSSKHYLPGEMFLYLGDAYPLEVVQGQKKPLVLEESFRLGATTQEEAAQLFERWYRAQARKILSERVRLYASQYRFQYKGIKITSARTRWGSCSVTGSLNFSWRLVMAPMDVVDYVVVHELVHTVSHNHSKRFWKRVEAIIPDYKERKKWLRKNGQQLMV